MKEIYAIIQPNRVQATKEALAAVGTHPLNAFPCMGHGRGQIDPRILDAAMKGSEEALAVLGQHPPLVPKRSLSIFLPDEQVEPAVQAIIRANQTGQHGDGKIYVCPVAAALRVRTGETGVGAL
ncbi:MAG: P-II family nitrogen regulator [Verrucomicrobiales bacterium]|nr:P-II family nitrogen regulator [Verrucomicrobiales bacterium]